MSCEVTGPGMRPVTVFPSQVPPLDLNFTSSPSHSHLLSGC